MLEIIKTKTSFPFMKYKWVMVLFSGGITIASLYFMTVKGFNFGVDFAGGIQMLVKLPADTEPSAQKLRDALEPLNIGGLTVQEFGSTIEKSKSEFSVHFAAEFSDNVKMEAVIEKSLAKFAQANEKLVAATKVTGIEKAYFTLTREIDFKNLEKAIRETNFGVMKLIDFQPFGRESANEYQLNFENIATTLVKGLEKNFTSPSGEKPQIQRVDFVGAKVGNDLKWSAILSLIICAALVFLYIFLRFDIVYAPGVILSLLHDVIIVAGMFSLFGLEFDLTIVAAILTLAGYSINDTIVIYDRIREVAGQLKGKPFTDIIDIAINQTLGRTLITGSTTLLSSAALWYWGGPVIHGFALAIFVGVVIGTYSSVFVASPCILLTQWFKTREVKIKKAA